MIDAIAGILKQGVRRSRVLTEFAQTLQFEFEHPPDGPVIMVHEMAGAGSGSVVEGLRGRYPRANVYHTHYLNPDTIRATYSRFVELRKHRGDALLPEEFLAARALERRLRTKKPGRWKVISLVRDPVARTVSAFLEHFHVNHPGHAPGYAEDPANTDRMAEMFLAPHEPERAATLSWFDLELRDVLGVDVFGLPFPHDAGHAEYRSAACDLLVIRREDLHAVGAGAIAHFLGSTDAGMNLSEHTANTDPPAGFAERLRLPAAYLDVMYDSRMARHFYSDSERARFRERWFRD